MPIQFKDNNNNKGQVQQPTVVTEVQEPPKQDIGLNSPGFTDALGAMFRLENPIYNVAQTMMGPSRKLNENDPDFDPYQEIADRKLTLTDDELDSFLLVDNKEAFDYEFGRIVKRRKDLATLSEFGMGSNIAAAVISGLVDPINYIPMGMFYKGYKAAKTTSRVANAVKTGLATSAAALPSMAVSEAILLESQPGRTTEEALANTLAGATFSGFLGSIGGAFKKPELDALKSNIDAGMRSEPFKTRESFADNLTMRQDDSVGAAKSVAKESTLEDLSIGDAPGPISNLFFKSWVKASETFNPYVRVMKNANVGIRRVMEKLTESPLQLSKNIAEPTEQSVETAIKAVRKPLAEAFEAEISGYKAYKQSAVANGKPVLSREQFQEAISKSIRRGLNTGDEITDQTARAYKEKLITPMAKESQDLGIISKDLSIDEADGHLSRMWINEKIVANESDFRFLIKSRVKEAFDAEVNSVQLKSKKIQADVEARASKAKTPEEAAKIRAKGALDIEGVELELRTRLSPEAEADYIEEVTSGIVRKLTTTDSYTQIPNLEMASRGPLKERTFGISDLYSVTTPDGRVIAVEDFIENNINIIAERYARIVKPEIELHKKFGTSRFEDILEELDIEHEKLKEGKSPAELLKLNKEFEAGKEDLSALWDLTRGTYQSRFGSPDDIWRRAGQSIRDFNYVTRMGMATASAVPDIGSIMRHGLFRLVGDGFIPVMKNLIKGRKGLSKKMARQYGKATEAVLAGRVDALYGISDPFTKGTKLERLIQAGTRKFANWNLQNYWNDGLQTITTLATQTRIIENINAKSLSPKEAKWMNHLGLGDDFRARIKKQLDANPEFVDDVQIANLDKWTDKGAQEAMTAAINKHVDTMIVVPGVADKPLVMNSNTGRTIGQFTSFGFAANQRVLLAGLQQGDFNVLAGFLTMTGLGMMAYYFRTPAEYLSDDPLVWFKEGIDRSGAATIPSMAINIGSGVATNSPDRAIVKALGPTGSVASDLLKLTKAVGSGQMTQSDVKAAKRMIPYQNLIWINNLNNRAVDAINENLNIPKRRKPKKSNTKRKIRR